MIKLRKVLNIHFEEEVLLENVETKKILLIGDYYHDNINTKIEGFLNGLTFCGKEYELLANELRQHDDFVEQD